MTEPVTKHSLDGWRTALYARAEQIARACLAEVQGLDVFDGDSVLRLLVSSRAIAPTLGCSSPFWLPSGSDPFPRWQRTLWGRRCKHYAMSLTRGMQAAKPRNLEYVEGDEEVRSVEENTECNFTTRITEVLRRDFLPPTGPNKEIATSLNNRGDIANFHVTYLDPTLFSALFWSLTDDVANIETIWDIIQREVIRHTDRLTRITKDNTCDESTVWWALAMMLERGEERFALKSNHNGEERRFEGHRGFARLAKTLLMHHDVDEPVWPKGDRALGEATAEIHDDIRTRLMLIKNWTGLLKLAERRNWDHWSELKAKMLDVTRGHLAILSQKRREITSHMYRTGLALEVFTELESISSVLFPK